MHTHKDKRLPRYLKHKKKTQLNVFFFIRLSHPTTIRQASNTPRQLNNELNQTLHEVDEDYELEIGNYNPVQTLFHDHGISLISLSSTSYNKIDHHLLQVNYFTPIGYNIDCEC